MCVEHHDDADDLGRQAIEFTLISADHLSESLIHAELFKEAKSLLRKYILVARRTRENGNEVILDLRTSYAQAIYRDTNSSRSDVHEAVAILEDVVRTARRVFGTEHPYFAEYRADLENARMRLADDESRAALAAPAPPTRRRRHRRRPK